MVLFYFQKSPKLPKTEGQVGAVKEAAIQWIRESRAAAGEKPGDQEGQGSEPARSGAYSVREHRTGEADAEIRRSTGFGASADGSEGASPCAR